MTKEKMLIANTEKLDQDAFMMMARFNCVVNMSDTTHSIEKHNALVNKFKNTSYGFKDNCPLCEMGSKIEGEMRNGRI